MALPADMQLSLVDGKINCRVYEATEHDESRRRICSSSGNKIEYFFGMLVNTNQLLTHMHSHGYKQSDFDYLYIVVNGKMITGCSIFDKENNNFTEDDVKLIKEALGIKE